MQEIYERGYTVPVSGESDSDAIHNAIAEAVTLGLNKTVIPRYNKRTGTCQWVLHAPVIVPGNFTLVLDNACVALTEKGVILAMGEEQKPLENLHIYGTGNAVLTDEGAFGALLRLAFVKNARVHGIRIKNHFARGMFCLGLTDSVISDITFSCPLPQNLSAPPEERRRSAGGIVLSAGCRSVSLERIFGTTCGHTVEISAFSGETENDTTRDITIRDIRSDCFVFSNVHLMNAEGHMLQNIYIENVTDTSKECSPYRAHSAVSVGESPFGRTPSALGEIRNLTVKNITSRGFSAVNLVHSVQDITIADLTLREDGGCALSCDRFLEYNNIYLCNVKFDDRFVAPYPIALVRKTAYVQPPAIADAHFYPYRAVCNMRDIHGGNFKINGVYANMLDNLLRITGKNRIEIYDVDVPNIVYDDIVGDDCIINEEE